jgi:hypothetical protein
MLVIAKGEHVNLIGVLAQLWASERLGTFFTAAFGAFAGAFAASRAHNKRTIVAELNALNAAHELSVAIANTFLGVKRQLVLPLNENFERIRLSYANHQTMVKAGTQAAFHFTADMQSLTLPATPHVALEKMIFEKTLVRGRALAALVSRACHCDRHQTPFALADRMEVNMSPAAGVLDLKSLQHHHKPSRQPRLNP